MKLTNLCRISNNFHRHSGKYLVQTSSFLQKYLKLTFFAKAPSLTYGKVLNTPLEGFVYDAPLKKLAIAPVEKYLTSTAWQS